VTFDLTRPAFRRARSDAQREERREAVLQAATEMLTEMPVSDLTLTALARRVCLAKSNVLRYFESREAVLLELLQRCWQEWLGAVPTALAAIPSPAAVTARADAMAAVLAQTLADRPTLCDLLGAHASVLEHNVSPEVAAQYKWAFLDGVAALGSCVREVLPELSETDAFRFAGSAGLVAAALWAHTRPSAAMSAAYDADPALAAQRLSFVPTATELLQVLLSGFLARKSL
jgi:AcrR family transcriptional regulator